MNEREKETNQKPRPKIWQGRLGWDDCVFVFFISIVAVEVNYCFSVMYKYRVTESWTHFGLVLSSFTKPRRPFPPSFPTNQTNFPDRTFPVRLVIGEEGSFVIRLFYGATYVRAAVSLFLSATLKRENDNNASHQNSGTSSKQHVVPSLKVTLIISQKRDRNCDDRYKILAEHYYYRM